MATQRQTSQRQIDANRRNGSLSRGPRRPEQGGLNALRHGIFARQALVQSGPNPESAAEFDRFAAALRLHVAPQGAIEELLLEQLIGLAWRWRRVLSFESASIAQQQNNAVAGFKSLEAMRDDTAFYGFSVHGHHRNLEVELERARSVVAALDTPNPLDVEPQVTKHVLILAKRLGSPVDEILARRQENLPAGQLSRQQVDDIVDDVCRRQAFSRADFWAAIRPLAEAARDAVAAEIQQKAAALQSQIDVAVIPSGAELAKIRRYEAHLSRHFFHILQEIERMQALRLHPRGPAALLTAPADVGRPEGRVPSESDGNC